MAGGPGGTNAAGQGARHDLDGEHTCGFFWSPEVDLLSVEEHEAKFPWMYLSRNRFDTNLHGFGKFRGGTGMVEIFTPHNVSRLRQHSLSHADRFSVNYGLFGGYAGPTNPRFVVRNSNLKTMMATNDPSLPFSLYELANGQAVGGEYHFERGNSASEVANDGDLFVMFVGSGGGYGDVLERDPAMVMQDLREGLITVRVARDLYLIAFDDKTLEVDIVETDRRRSEERQARRRRGLSYDRFVSSWSARRPPEAALKYYGEWPNPKPASTPSLV
jgi:acetophenone carboxylase